jgi:hypothetical protein
VGSLDHASPGRRGTRPDVDGAVTSPVATVQAAESGAVRSGAAKQNR